jgi:hypothetical protein
VETAVAKSTAVEATAMEATAMEAAAVEAAAASMRRLRRNWIGDCHNARQRASGESETDRFHRGYSSDSPPDGRLLSACWARPWFRSRHTMKLDLGDEAPRQARQLLDCGLTGLLSLLTSGSPPPELWKPF